MNPLYVAASEIQGFFVDRGWKFCLIGGVAAIRWGTQRTTGDVDVSLLTGFGNEEFYVDEVLRRFRPRRQDARELALSARVLLVETSNGVPLDIALAGLSFEEKVIERATSIAFGPNLTLKIASPEDIVVMKSFAGRHRDWADIEGILVRQRGQLDWDHILKELTPLCELKESPEIVAELLRMRDELAAE